MKIKKIVANRKEDQGSRKVKLDDKKDDQEEKRGEVSRRRKT